MMSDSKNKSSNKCLLLERMRYFFNTKYYFGIHACVNTIQISLRPLYQWIIKFATAADGGEEQFTAGNNSKSTNWCSYAFWCTLHCFLNESKSHAVRLARTQFGYLCVNGFFYNPSPNLCSLVMAMYICIYMCIQMHIYLYNLYMHAHAYINVHM